MAAKKRVDYDRIEAGWRAGLLSPHQLAATYVAETGEPVSHAAIIKHFKKEGVPRNLGAKIKAKSDAMVTAAMVTELVTPETIRRDRDIIDDGAAVLTGVRLSHRKDINRHRAIAVKMLEELDESKDDLAVRVDISKKLSDTLKTLIGLERDAYDIVTASKLEMTGENGGPILTKAVAEMTDAELSAMIND